MGNIFVWCFYQWVDEKTEMKDSGSGYYDSNFDYDSICGCDCVVEW